MLNIIRSNVFGKVVLIELLNNNSHGSLPPGGLGGFHLIAKIIRELKSHMIPYKFKCSHWLKLQHSDWRLIFHQ